MEPISNERIRSVRYYKCGYCTNRLGLAYKKETFNKRVFPSGVFLVEHASRGYLLFDTGYSTDIKRSGCLGWFYRRLNPVTITADDEITTQLKADGINPDDISYVVLSHLHPDHIGGCKFFPNAKFLITNDASDNLVEHSIGDLIFNSLIPDWLQSKIEVVDDGKYSKTDIDGLNAYDIFDDKSIFLIDLPGHASGHIGALIPDKLLLGGDACWSNDLVTKSQFSRWTLRHINANNQEYISTLEKLTKLRESGIRLCFSHEHYEEKFLEHV